MTTNSPTATTDFAPEKWPWCEYWYDRKAALRPVRFIEKYCSHVEDGVDTKAGDPARLHWWQKRLVMRFFGWKHLSDDRRRFIKLFLEIPRKNGKTTFAAWLICYLLFADGEKGAQIVCAASTTEQAQIIFDIVAEMIRNNWKLRSKAKIYKKSIFIPGTNSSFRVLSGKKKGKHGKNLQALVVDEVHEQESRELIDALATSNIARRQPVELYLTTAGDDPNTIAYEMHEYAIRVAENPRVDPTFLPQVYALDLSKDPEAWKREENWFKVNPNLGVTFTIEKMRGDFEKAKNIPAYENAFKRLRLCIWVEQEHRAIPMDHWRKCVHLRTKESLRKRECYLGLDLSSTTDTTAGTLVFPPLIGADFYDTQSFFWYPRLSITERLKRAKKDLTPWADQGYIKFTEGNQVDYRVIRSDIKELGRQYYIREIAIDRWNSTQLQQDLDEDGFVVVPYSQGYGPMSDPTKQLLGLILDHRLNHDANPVLEWMASYFCIQMNHAGDIRPAKDKAREKIDGIVSLILGLSRAILHRTAIENQITRGLITG